MLSDIDCKLILPPPCTLTGAVWSVPRGVHPQWQLLLLLLLGRLACPTAGADHRHQGRGPHGHGAHWIDIIFGRVGRVSRRRQGWLVARPASGGRKNRIPSFIPFYDTLLDLTETHPEGPAAAHVRHIEVAYVFPGMYILVNKHTRSSPYHALAHTTTPHPHTSPIVEASVAHFAYEKGSHGGIAPIFPIFGGGNPDKFLLPVRVCLQNPRALKGTGQVTQERAEAAATVDPNPVLIRERGDRNRGGGAGAGDRRGDDLLRAGRRCRRDAPAPPGSSCPSGRSALDDSSAVWVLLRPGRRVRAVPRPGVAVLCAGIDLVQASTSARALVGNAKQYIQTP